KHILRSANREWTQLEPPEVQDVERDNVTAADLAEHILDRHGHIVEVNRGRRASFDPHLLLFGAGLDAGEAALDQECCELFAADFSEDRIEIGPSAVGDPHLLAV